MAEYTPNLNLLKKDPATDGNDTFNIKTMLNDNWDKIDEKMGEVENKASNITAENIKLSDGSTVEAKFTEIDTDIDQLFQSGLDGKNLLETSIKSKGGTVSKQAEVATFNELDAGIQSIETDKTGDATAVAMDILLGKVAYAKGQRIVGTMPNYGDKIYTPSDAVQTGGAGFYNSIKVNPRPALSGTADPANVLAGKYFYKNSYSRQLGTMPNRGAPAQTLTTQGGQYNLPSGYYTGGYVKAQFANLVAGNIKKGVNIGGIVGNLEEKQISVGTISYISAGKIKWIELNFEPRIVVAYAKFYESAGGSSAMYSKDHGILQNAMVNSGLYLEIDTHRVGFSASKYSELADVKYHIMG